MSEKIKTVLSVHPGRLLPGNAERRIHGIPQNDYDAPTYLERLIGTIRNVRVARFSRPDAGDFSALPVEVQKLWDNCHKCSSDLAMLLKMGIEKQFASGRPIHALFFRGLIPSFIFASKIVNIELRDEKRPTIPRFVEITHEDVEALQTTRNLSKIGEVVYTADRELLGLKSHPEDMIQIFGNAVYQTFFEYAVGEVLEHHDTPLRRYFQAGYMTTANLLSLVEGIAYSKDLAPRLETLASSRLRTRPVVLVHDEKNHERSALTLKQSLEMLLDLPPDTSTMGCLAKSIIEHQFSEPSIEKIVEVLKKKIGEDKGGDIEPIARLVHDAALSAMSTAKSIRHAQELIRNLKPERKR